VTNGYKGKKKAHKVAREKKERRPRGIAVKRTREGQTIRAKTKAAERLPELLVKERTLTPTTEKR